MLRNLYFKLTNYFVVNYERKRKSFDQQKVFLQSLKKPSDDFDFAYNKYLCQLFYHYPLALRICYNFGSVFMIPVLVIRYKLNNKNNVDTDPLTCGKLIITKTSMKTDDIAPEDLFSEMGGAIAVSPSPSFKAGVIDDGVSVIFKEMIKRYWTHPYFVMFVLVKLGATANLKRMYQPGGIVNFAFERNFANPLISLYCERNDMQQICFMHGDTAYSVDQAYSRPTIYCVWDEHYVDFYKKLYCAPKRFVVYIPQKWKIENVVSADGQYPYYATYYFSGETEKVINGVKRVFDLFKDRGLNCKIRMHPQFSDEKHIRSVFDQYDIEDKSVTLQQSLASTKYVISLRSTVLTQAYFAGKEVVIDDVSDPEKYENQLLRDYIMTKKCTLKLSELV